MHFDWCEKVRKHVLAFIAVSDHCVAGMSDEMSASWRFSFCSDVMNLGGQRALKGTAHLFGRIRIPLDSKQHSLGSNIWEYLYNPGCRF